MDEHEKKDQKPVAFMQQTKTIFIKGLTQNYTNVIMKSCPKIKSDSRYPLRSSAKSCMILILQQAQDKREKVIILSCKIKLKTSIQEIKS